MGGCSLCSVLLSGFLSSDAFTMTSCRKKPEEAFFFLTQILLTLDTHIFTWKQTGSRLLLRGKSNSPWCRRKTKYCKTKSYQSDWIEGGLLHTYSHKKKTDTQANAYKYIQAHTLTLMCSHFCWATCKHLTVALNEVSCQESIVLISHACMLGLSDINSLSSTNKCFF